jgi:hypothetical protein
VPAAARCELDTSFCSNDSLGRPQLHSPSLACRVFLINKPYSSIRIRGKTIVLLQVKTSPLLYLSICKFAAAKHSNVTRTTKPRAELAKHLGFGF